MDDVSVADQQNISGSLAVAAADGDATLVTCRGAAFTLFITRVVVWISTSAAQSWSFEDSNSPAKQVAEIPATPADSTRWDFDFGPFGVPLTEGKNFVLNMSAAGLAGHIEWYGYQKRTGVAGLTPHH